MSHFGRTKGPREGEKPWEIERERRDTRPSQGRRAKEKARVLKSSSFLGGFLKRLR